MSKFSAGDKVSFLNEKLQGTVKAEIGKGKVMVLLDDGFEIPVSEGEIILVSRARDSVTEGSAMPEKLSRPVLDVNEQVYLGLVLDENKAKAEVKLWLLNNSSFDLLYTICRQQEAKIKGIAKGELNAASASLIATFLLEDADAWKNLHVQALKYKVQGTEISAPLSRQIKLKPSQLLQEKHKLPFLDASGLLISIDQTEKAAEPPLKQEKEEKPAIQKPEKPEEIIDLHVGALLEPGIDLSPQSILSIQLEHFMNSLEKALAFGMERIIFIHGVGSGSLKNAIRKRLEQHREVLRFEDADPKFFGYGATAVYLKSR